MKRDLIYLASPYWHNELMIRDARVAMSRNFVVERVRQWKVNSGNLDLYIAPLLYTSEIKHELQSFTNDDWIELTDDLLRCCRRMDVLQLPGWEESKGLASELATAEKLSIPVDYITMEEIHDRFTRTAGHLLNLHKQWDERMAAQNARD